jgi:hypothetical protein
VQKVCGFFCLHPHDQIDAVMLVLSRYIIEHTFVWLLYLCAIINVHFLDRLQNNVHSMISQDNHLNTIDRQVLIEQNLFLPYDLMQLIVDMS